MFGDNWVSPELITGFSSPGLWHFITRELIPHQMWLIAAEVSAVWLCWVIPVIYACQMPGKHQAQSPSHIHLL